MVTPQHTELSRLVDTLFENRRCSNIITCIEPGEPSPLLEELATGSLDGLAMDLSSQVSACSGLYPFLQVVATTPFPTDIRHDALAACHTSGETVHSFVLEYEYKVAFMTKDNLRFLMLRATRLARRFKQASIADDGIFRQVITDALAGHLMCSMYFGLEPIPHPSVVTQN